VNSEKLPSRSAVTSPSYLRIYRRGILEQRARAAHEVLADCVLCPRQRHVNRFQSAAGRCRTGARAFVSAFHPHFGEEAPISGRRGSGTIFFGSCNLLCVFCQNWSTSHLSEGREITDRRLGEMMLELQALGCHNINLVTPTHMVPQILASLLHAIEGGLTVPLVYNSSGYDLVPSLELLDGVVDLYMPDLKMMDADAAGTYLLAPDYPDIVRPAIREMHRQVGDLELDEDGIATHGLLVRHLVMPGGLAGTEEAMRFLVREISPRTYVNLMDQYRPGGNAIDHPAIARRITGEEFEAARKAAWNAGVRRSADM
jgi:putative pyruvate formate lyase activating enzyme